MRAGGWTRHSLKPGDKVKVAMRPMRNGQKGGSLMSVTLPDGSTLISGTPGTIGGGAESGSRPAQSQ
jgi:hypothetical protein